MRGVVRFVASCATVIALLYGSGLLLTVFMLAAPIIEPFPLPTAGIAALLLGALGLVASQSKRRYAAWALGIAVVVWAVTQGVARQQALPAPLQAHLSARGRAGAAAVVTGSTEGIGFAIAQALIARGWAVFLHGRSLEKVERAARTLNSQAGAGGGQAIAAAAADLASFAAVADFGAAVLRHPRGRDVELLVLNAGLARTDKALTSDGFDTLMQVNCMAGAHLQLLLEAQLASRPLSRVVHVTSLSSSTATPNLDEAANFTWTPPATPDDSAYGRTKMCQIAWARRAGAGNVTVVSVHPGGCVTGMGGDSVSEQHPFPLFPLRYWQAVVRPLMLAVYRMTWFPPTFCADAVLYAASTSAPPPGTYFGRFQPMPTIFEPALARSPDYVARVSSAIRESFERT